jgi:type VI secretion system secreted protein VgrG
MNAMELLFPSNQWRLGELSPARFNKGRPRMSNPNQNPGQQNQTPGQKPGQQQQGGGQEKPGQQKPGQQQQNPNR